MEVECTDRYGGNHPSWLTTCHGECEGMGCYPEWVGPVGEDGDADLSYTEQPEWVEYRKRCQAITARYENDEIDQAEMYRLYDEFEAPADYWAMVKCPKCHGTGKVGTLRAISRVPKWFWRGCGSFMRFMRDHKMYRAEWTPWPKYVWISLKACFLCDLGVKI